MNEQFAPVSEVDALIDEKTPLVFPWLKHWITL
jgi:hypothetical protein